MKNNVTDQKGPAKLDAGKTRRPHNTKRIKTRVK
jgi:hypothetical protein